MSEHPALLRCSCKFATCHSTTFWYFAGLLMLVIVAFKTEQRLDALESRAAWFMPEGQTHPQEVPRDR